MDGEGAGKIAGRRAERGGKQRRLTKGKEEPRRKTKKRTGTPNTNTRKWSSRINVTNLNFPKCVMVCDSVKRVKSDSWISQDVL